MDRGYCSFISAWVVFSTPVLLLSFPQNLTIHSWFSISWERPYFEPVTAAFRRGGPLAGGWVLGRKLSTDSRVSLEILWAIWAEFLTSLFLFRRILLQKNLGPKREQALFSMIWSSFSVVCHDFSWLHWGNSPCQVCGWLGGVLHASHFFHPLGATSLGRRGTCNDCRWENPRIRIPGFVHRVSWGG